MLKIFLINFFYKTRQEKKKNVSEIYYQTEDGMIYIYIYGTVKCVKYRWLIFLDMPSKCIFMYEPLLDDKDNPPSQEM